MEQDELIIWVYLWVCEAMDQFGQRCQAQNLRLRSRGFAPALSDEEALTIELCGEMFRLHTDKGLYWYFNTHYKAWFPALPCRTTFVRHISQLWRVKQELQRQLLAQHQAQLQRVQSVDTWPLPVCAASRRWRDRCFLGEAQTGYCAAKRLFYYGFKLGLRITPNGLITHHALLNASTNDSRHLPALVEGHQGLVPVDKGFFDPFLWRLLAQQGLHIVGRGPKNTAHHRPPQIGLDNPSSPPLHHLLARTCFKVRKLIETVGALLCQRFAINHIRVHDLWHFENRVLRKVLAHNLLFTINLALRRKPLDFDGLVRD
jgi:hypothetical protein